METNYKQINLEDNCSDCKSEKKTQEQIEAIKRENQGIMNVAFSLTAICSAIIAGTAVSAAALL